MPGSLARPPRHEHSDRGVGGRLTEELAEELEEDHGGDTVGATTALASKRHHPVCYGDGGAAQNPWPSGQAHHRTWGRRRGCRRHPTSGDGGDATAGTESGVETPVRSSRRRSSRRGEIDRGDAQGRDRPRRRAGAMATNGGKIDESLRSDGRAWGDEANAPHGDGTAHRSSPESSGIIADDSQSPKRGTG
jgi:hypothetical protein